MDVGDADGGDAGMEGGEGVLEFGYHATADGAVGDEGGQLGFGDAGYEGGGVGGVAQHARELEAEGEGCAFIV